MLLSNPKAPRRDVEFASVLAQERELNAHPLPKGILIACIVICTGFIIFLLMGKISAICAQRAERRRASSSSVSQTPNEPLSHRIKRLLFKIVPSRLRPCHRQPSSSLPMSNVPPDDFPALSSATLPAYPGQATLPEYSPRSAIVRFGIMLASIRPSHPGHHDPILEVGAPLGSPPMHSQVSMVLIADPPPAYRGPSPLPPPPDTNSAPQ